MKRIYRTLSFVLTLLWSTVQAQAPPSPGQLLGFTIGDDYKLANFQQISSYFQLLSQSSNRIRVNQLGYTTEGNKFFVAIISSADNLSRLEYYKTLQSELADPRKITDAIADSLVENGKTIVSINCSIHATEIGASQMSMDLAYELATFKDSATQEILDNVIILLLPVHNPDGLDMVVSWYNRYLGTRYEGSRLPWLYHKYTGHDINRDWYMLTQKETRLTVEKIYNVWYPQIVLDMHQMGKNAPRLFLPPYIDPIDPNVDPILVSEIAMLGQTIATDLTAQAKAGVITNVIYDAWSPSRAYMHYHDGIRILSEVASCNIASPVKLDISNQNKSRALNLTSSSWNYVLPWHRGDWHLKDIIEYDKAVAWALITHAAKHRKQWLRNFYQVGKNAISSKSSPYAYIIPDDQWDKAMQYELLRVLHRGQVEIHQAEHEFYTSGKKFSKGSFIILKGQPFFSFARTLLSIQKYPVHSLKKAYDITGHTISHLMEVKVIPVEHPLKTRFSKVDSINLPPGKIYPAIEDFDYMTFSHKSNYAFKAINRLLAKDYQLFWLNDLNNNQLDLGTIIVKADTSDTNIKVIANELAIDFTPLPLSFMPLSVYKIKQPKVGLYKGWVASIDEGWTRFVLEEYDFDYTSVTDSIIKRGHLTEDFNVIIFPSLPAQAIKNGNKPDKFPPKYCGGLGQKGTDNLRQFVQEGGTLIAIDAAVNFVINEFKLPLRTIKADGLWAPGSVVRVKVDNSHPIGFGLPPESAFIFYRNPILNTKEGNKVAWYPQNSLLISGALVGEDILQGKPLILEFNRNYGKIILFAFRPLFRAQTRGVYKLLFNSIFYSNAVLTSLEH